MEAMVYKTILSYKFVDNKNYKVGNQKDGGIEYTQEIRDHRRAWKEKSYEGLWANPCNTSLAIYLARHDCPPPPLPHII